MNIYFEVVVVALNPLGCQIYPYAVKYVHCHAYTLIMILYGYCFPAQNYICPSFGVQQHFSHNHLSIFSDILVRMVPGISPLSPHALACHPALGWLPSSWIGPDQHSVFNSVNEGSEGQNYSLHVDI